MTNVSAINLEVEKECRVPLESLYKAWTTEEDLRQWWQPMGNRLARMINEIKEGGNIEYVFENGDGQQAFTIRGNYKEVEEGKRLVYSWEWHLPTPAVHDSAYMLTVDFSGEGESSRIHIKQDQFKDEENLQPHKEGWEEALEALKAHVENQK